MNTYCDPLFFAPNRVWRCYLGGALLDELMTGARGEDCFFPENWLGSATAAENAEHATSPDEGLSRLRDGGALLRELLREDGETILGSSRDGLGVLCKFLDSAIRLPIQCHPDREFARKYCRSEYGKTESWLILRTREIGGEKPYILLGFKPGIDRDAFRRAVEAQDIPAIVGMLHKVEVQPGEVYFIPGRLPHAIGPGVLMTEVQEPTDLVVQPEKRIGELELTALDMWGRLTPEQGLDCFEYRGVAREALLARLRIAPELEWERGGARFYRVIDARHTDCFRVGKLVVPKGATLVYELDSPWQLGIVIGGKGTLKAASEQSLACGDSFLVPNPVRKMEITAEEDLTLIWVG